MKAVVRTALAARSGLGAGQQRRTTGHGRDPDARFSAKRSRASDSAARGGDFGASGWGSARASTRLRKPGSSASRSPTDALLPMQPVASAGRRAAAASRPFHKPGAGCTASPRCWRSRTAISSSYPIEQTPTSGCICNSTPTTDARAIPTALPSPARAVVLARANAALSELVPSGTRACDDRLPGAKEKSPADPVDVCIAVKGAYPPREPRKACRRVWLGVFIVK